MGGRTILDDSYNANPRSMVAAAAALVGLAGQGRAVAVLGHMAELGPDSDGIHRETRTSSWPHGLDVLVAVGPRRRPLADRL